MLDFAICLFFYIMLAIVLMYVRYGASLVFIEFLPCCGMRYECFGVMLGLMNIN